jgi:peptidoglycan/LPS O-acetylase OafA/YrhL
MALSLAGTLPLAAASWWWVEKPALRLKMRARQRPFTVQKFAVADA